MKKYSENKISWNITKPLSSACIYTEDDESIKVPNYILEKKMPIKNGDSVALMYFNNEVMFTEPVKGKNYESILKAIEKGMKKKISLEREDINKVYILISRFGGSENRIKLVKKYEQGNLTVADLLGGYEFYEGNLKRKNKIWVYGLGS